MTVLYNLFSISKSRMKILQVEGFPTPQNNPTKKSALTTPDPYKVTLNFDEVYTVQRIEPCFEQQPDKFLSLKKLLTP